MSDLSGVERAYLEKLYGMSDGYVIDFNNSSFGSFFGVNYDIDIHSTKYTNNGTSKAKKLREFWRIESNSLVARSIKDLIELYKINYGNDLTSSNDLLDRCEAIVPRLFSGTPALDAVKMTARGFNSSYINTQINRMEIAIDNDPALAIGTAKELLETCCKTILLERNSSVEGKPDVPRLTRLTLKELKLTPDDIPNKSKGSEIIKRLLQNLSTIGNSLAELRNLYGSGHGGPADSKGLTARHARLAVGSVSTLVTFLYETHKETLSSTH